MKTDKQAIEEMARVIYDSDILCHTCGESTYTYCADAIAKMLYNAGYRRQSENTVEVVRCKGCEHSCFIKSCSKYECQKGCGALKYSTDFCSYGEPKMKGGE